MPDQGTIDSMATKFDAWASSLSADEQRTLAEWWDARNADVVGHADANWWQEPGAWSGGLEGELVVLVGARPASERRGPPRPPRR